MHIQRAGSVRTYESQFEILTLTTFTGEYCKVTLDIHLKKWLEIPIYEKFTYTQYYMFIKVGNSDFWVNEIEWNDQV